MGLPYLGPLDAQPSRVAIRAELGGAGAASATLVALTVATLARGYAEVVVANAAIGPSSKLSAWFAPALDAENDLEELADSGMAVWVLPEAGQLRFVLTGNGAFVGVYSVFYEVLQ